jgi:hypothetical protein
VQASSVNRASRLSTSTRVGFARGALNLGDTAA